MKQGIFRDAAQDHEKSKWDSGLSIIFRLDDIHKALHLANRDMDVNSMYRLLISLFKEVLRKLKDKELMRHFEYWDAVKKDYFEILSLKRNKEQVPDHLFDSFHWWEIQLTLAEEKYELGMPNRGGARYALK